MPENINAILVRIEGTVQRVGFRRFVERAARRFKIVGYAENMKDGTVRILAQGDSGGLDEFLSEVKNAPRPIIVDSMIPKKVKVVPSLKHFQIKVGSMAVELQEGFGAVETQFGDYREEFQGFANRTDDNLKSLNNNFNDYRQEFKDYRSEFRGFTSVTDENFKSLDTKYGEISSKLSQILEALEKEATETRKELTRAVDNLSRLVEEYVKRLPPRDTQ